MPGFSGATASQPLPYPVSANPPGMPQPYSEVSYPNNAPFNPSVGMPQTYSQSSIPLTAPPGVPPYSSNYQCFSGPSYPPSNYQPSVLPSPLPPQPGFASASGYGYAAPAAYGSSAIQPGYLPHYGK